MNVFKCVVSVLVACGVSLSAQEIKLTHKGPVVPFKALPDFKDHSLAVFATAPGVNMPVSVIAEPGGALYVLCDGNAGLGLGKNQGSILRLVDKDNDGKADTMTKFVPSIDTPRGGHFVDGVLYVMHPPFVSAFKDTDGDGVADEHKVLAQGFGHDMNWRRGGDHTANDLRVGIDGWIYTALGDFGATATGSDGSKVQLMSGGVIRMRMDGSDLQFYTQGTRNTYDVALSHKLDLVTLDNTNDGDGWNARVHHLTPLAHMGYPNLYKFFSEDAMPPLFDHGGGSGVGALHLQEPGFPDWFNNRFHTMSWGRLYTHTLKPYDATFINDDFVSLQATKIVEIDVDGSSRLYFATFENGSARTAPGTTVGQILIAKPNGWKYQPFPEIDKLPLSELISSLDKGSNVLRQNAQHELINRPDKSIEKLLMTKAQDKSASLEARIAALYAINLRNTKSAVTNLKALAKDDTIREYALRALIDRKDNAKLSLDSLIKEGLSDKNPRVQMIAAFGARLLNLSQLTHDLLAISEDGDERTPVQVGKANIHRAVPHTARRALVEMQPVSQLLTALKDPNLKTASLAVLRQLHDKNATQSIVQKLQTAKSFEDKVPYIKVLLRTFHKEEAWDGNSWWGTRPNSAGPYFKGATWEMSENIARALREEVKKMNEEQQKQMLYLTRRYNISLEELKLDIKIDPIEQLVNQPTHNFNQLDDLLSAVTDKQRTEAFRLKAFRSALNVKGAIYGYWCSSILKSIGKIPADSEFYKTASQEFINSPSHRMTFMQKIPKSYKGIKKLPKPLNRLYCDMVVGLVQSPLTTPEDRNKLTGGFSKEGPSIELLESITANKAKAFLNLVKKSTKSKNSKIAEASKTTLAALSSSSNSLKGKLVGELDYDKMKAAVMKMSGDTEIGKSLFIRQSCIACHSILLSEPQKGPYLGTVGNLFDRDQLITHIVKPEAEVAQGFQTFTFAMKDGSAVSGFVTARDDKNITVRSMIGTSQTIDASKVAKESVSKNSMMPPGLVNNLSLEEFASLVDYLQSLH